MTKGASPDAGLLDETREVIGHLLFQNDPELQKAAARDLNRLLREEPEAAQMLYNAAPGLRQAIAKGTVRFTEARRLLRGALGGSVKAVTPQGYKLLAQEMKQNTHSLDAMGRAYMGHFGPGDPINMSAHVATEVFEDGPSVGEAFAKHFSDELNAAIESGIARPESYLDMLERMRDLAPRLALSDIESVFNFDISRSERASKFLRGKRKDQGWEEMFQTLEERFGPQFESIREDYASSARAANVAKAAESGLVTSSERISMQRARFKGLIPDSALENLFMLEDKENPLEGPMHNQITYLMDLASKRAVVNTNLAGAVDKAGNPINTDMILHNVEPLEGNRIRLSLSSLDRRNQHRVDLEWHPHEYNEEALYNAIDMGDEEAKIRAKVEDRILKSWRASGRSFGPEDVRGAVHERMDELRQGLDSFGPEQVQSILRGRGTFSAVHSVEPLYEQINRYLAAVPDFSDASQVSGDWGSAMVRHVYQMREYERSARKEIRQTPLFETGFSGVHVSPQYIPLQNVSAEAGMEVAPVRMTHTSPDLKNALDEVRQMLDERLKEQGYSLDELARLSFDPAELPHSLRLKMGERLLGEQAAILPSGQQLLNPLAGGNVVSLPPNFFHEMPEDIKGVLEDAVATGRINERNVRFPSLGELFAQAVHSHSGGIGALGEAGTPEHTGKLVSAMAESIAGQMNFLRQNQEVLSAP
jgi:hypothetical protein